MSSTARSQKIAAGSSEGFAATAASYVSEREIAWSKIVGFDVTPRMPSSTTSRESSPESIRSRLMVSSQGLWPYSMSCSTAFGIFRLLGTCRGDLHARH